MSKLRDCYDRIQSILGEDNEYSVEPFESVVLVEKYRQYWKPEKTRIVLLAESHVFTDHEDMNITLPDIEDLPGYPKEYAKFVYCLAYGEPGLTNNSSHPKRDGTWQFWKIFYSCNNCIKSNADFKPLLRGKRGTSFRERLPNKIRLLKNLKQKGIWLVDASIIALYRDRKKPKPSVFRKIVKKSWDCYTKDVVKSANPDHIICIGKGVYDVLEDDLNQISHTSVHLILQPNAHLSSEDQLKNYKKCGEICRYG